MPICSSETDDDVYKKGRVNKVAEILVILNVFVIKLVYVIGEIHRQHNTINNCKNNDQKAPASNPSIVTFKYTFLKQFIILFFSFQKLPFKGYFP